MKNICQCHQAKKTIGKILLCINVKGVIDSALKNKKYLLNEKKTIKSSKNNHVVEPSSHEVYINL